MKCQRDCPGTIQDGYCDTCGMAPARTATAAPPAPARTGDHTLGAHRAALLVAPADRRAAAARAPAAGAGASAAAWSTSPPINQVDPATAIMAAAEVPEDKRYCAKCGNPVGRSRDDRPGRTAGFCPSCGEPFNFTPKLVKGDLVGGQYEVVGPLAHGGLGWIYLAVRQERLGPLGGAQGPAQLGRRGRAWPPPWPSAGSWPRSSTRTSSRSTTSWSTTAPATSSWSTSAASRSRASSRTGANGRQRRPAAAGPGARVRPGDHARVRLSARPRPDLLRLQAGQRDPDRRPGQAHRPRRRGAHRRPRRRAVRHGRLPGAGDRHRRPVDRLRPLHHRPYARRADHRLPRLPEHVQGQPAGPRPPSTCSGSTSRSTGCCSGPPAATRRNGSSTPPR